MLSELQIKENIEMLRYSLIDDGVSEYYVDFVIRVLTSVLNDEYFEVKK